MGIGSSIQEVIETKALSTEGCDMCDSHDEARYCTRCTKSVCISCCPHKHNVLFDAKTIPANVEKIIFESKGLTRIEPKCGTYTHADKLVVFGEVFYNDKFCKCCTESSEWKLFAAGKTSEPGQVTKRIHKEDRSSIFPGDACASRMRKLTYFTVPCHKTIYSFQKHDTYRKVFQTKGSCFGIACFDKGLAVTMELKTGFAISSEWQVQLFDTNGNLKRQIFTGSDQQPLFSKPLFLDSNEQENVLFVSENEKNAVIALNAKGEVLFQYTDARIRQPLGIAIDSEENIYVACGKTVVQVEKDGKDSKELLTLRNHEVVVDVCFDRKNNRLNTIQKSGPITTFHFQL